MKLPIANACVTELAAGGFSENYSDDEGTGTASWTGSEGAYLVEKLVSVLNANGGGLDRQRQDYLVIPYEISSLADIGGTVTYSQGAAEATRKVQNIERHQVAGTARLWLETAPQTT